jgi:hypothetical protein
LVVGATQLGGEVKQLLASHLPSYLVVKRPYQGQILHYAFPAEEAYTRINRLEMELSDGGNLDLHETDASPASQLGANLPATGSGSGPSPTNRRIVLLHGTTPFGVIPEPEARVASNFVCPSPPAAAPGKDVMNEIKLRRLMPTFSITGRGTVAPSSPRTPRPATAPVSESEMIRKMRESGEEFTDLPVPRRGRHGRKPGSPAAASIPSPESVTCQFHAEMPAEIQVGKIATVQVTVSRENLEFIVSAVSAGAEAPLDPKKKITIQVLAKAHARNDGDDRADLLVPDPGKPVELHFDIVPTHAGCGVIHVIARQGPLPIVTIELRPQFVRGKPDAARRIDGAASANAPEPFEKPCDQLRIDERLAGTKVFYQFEFYSERLGVIERFESPHLKGGSEAFVNKRYKQIEDRWVSTKGDITAFQAELRAIGGQLWTDLFPPELQKRLWDDRKALRSVQIFSSEPFIPWELVHFKQPGRSNLPEETLFLGQCGAVRWLIGAPLPPKILRIRSERARTLVPKYPHPDYELPETIDEEKFVRKLFNASPVRADQNAVRALLAGPAGFDLLHFAGHGRAETDNIAEAHLLLTGRVEGQNYIEETINTTTTTGYADLRGDVGNRPLVVLNACQAGRAGYTLTGMGGFAQAFLNAGAGLFVGTLWSVGDTLARVLLETFYEELKAGKTVSEAVIEARNKAASTDATWLAYVFYAHPEARLVLK